MNHELSASRQMKTPSKLIHFMWLVVVLIMFGATLPIVAAFSTAPISFGCDGRVQASIAYDRTSLLVFDYDSAPVSLADEMVNGRIGTSGTFAKSAGFLAAEGTGSLRLNIFGEGEAPGFVDTSTSANFANGRPLTSTFGNGSAGDIFIRSAPVTGDGTLSEIVRLSQPGTRITLMQPASGFQGQSLINAFGNNATVDFTRTFTSQTVAPGVDMTIMRLIVGGH